MSFFVEFCSGGLGQSGCVPFCSVVFWKVTAVELCWDGLSWDLLSFGGSVESS